MKWLFFTPFLLFAGISEDLLEGPTHVDQITYEWLVNEAVLPHDTQHVKVFKKLFESARVKTLLEFGLGYSTKYFLDHCNKVISVDVISHGYGPATMQKFLRVYADYSNWIPIAFFSGYMGCDYSWAPYKHLGSESVYKATSYQHAHHKNYANLDGFYLVELEAFISNLLKYNKVDVAFVGHAIFIRGDFVQLLFEKVPFIIAHNTEARRVSNPDDIYGLSRVVTPDSYEEIFFPVKGGTTLWVSRQEKYKKVIEVLQAYAKTL